jgi:CHAT domain-containing protein
MTRVALPAGLVIVASLAGCLGDSSSSGSRRTAVDTASARTQQAAADGAYSRGAYDSAGAIYGRVAALADRNHDTLMKARALTQAGLAAWRSGRYTNARTLGEQALALKISAGLARELPKSYNALGLLAHDEGRFSQAIDAFNRAESAAVDVGDSATIAKARGNAGLVFSDIGDYARARRGLSALRDFARAKSDTQLYANSLVNLGMVEIGAGSPAASLPLLANALRLERVARFAAGEENALGQIATAYHAMGEPQSAIAYLDSALSIARANGLRQPETDDLQLLAKYFGESGDHARVLEFLKRAAPIADSLGMRNIQGDIARSQARALFALGDLRGARQRAEAARRFHADAGATLEQMWDELTIAELGQRAGHSDGFAAKTAALASARRLAATIDSRVVRVELGLGEARIAELASDWQAVLSTLTRIQNDLSATTTAHDWEASELEARSYLALGRVDDAIRLGREAVRSIERVRARFTSGPLRTSYAVEQASVYSNLVMALLRRGETAEAFKVADAARSRALLEHLSAAKSDSSSRTAAGDLAAAEQLLRRIDRLMELLRVADTGSSSRRTLPADDQTEFLSQQIAESRRDYETLMRRTRVADRQTIAMARGDLPDPERIRATLRPGEAMLEYFVTDTQLVTFVVTQRSIRALGTPISDDALSSRVRLARDLVGRRESTPAAQRAVLSGLYDVLIAPAKRGGLLDGIRTLAIVPHSVLAYLPFAALIEPRTERYLVQDFDLFALPSGSSLPGVRNAPSPDTRLETAVFAPFPTDLPGTGAEAEAIGHLTAASLRYLGANATESTLRAKLAEPRIVHVATHGVLNARSPMFSRIELARASSVADPSNDGRLEVHEVLDLTIRSPLVFLSGCETGNGNAWSTSFARGDDYATLAEAFLYAGARNVISTLWRIEDRAAASFATTFYSGLGTKTPVEALGMAQRATLASRDYASPYYWAAYVTSGDGRSIGAQNRTHLSVQ